MREKFINMKRTAAKVVVCGFALLLLSALIVPQAAWASTAANTVIRNTATVTYQDTAGTAMTPVSATIDIMVAYVCSPATLSTPTDITTPPGAAVYNYTITSNANDRIRII